MRRALVAILFLLLLAACAQDAYPLPSDPESSSLRSPAAVGESTQAVLIYLDVRPGDRIELVGAEAVGSLDGATVKFLLSRPVLEPVGTARSGGISRTSRAPS